MREQQNMRKILYTLLLFLPLLASSCFNDEEETELDDYCYIKSVSLGSIRRAIHTTDTLGRDTVYYTTFTASSVDITIDQKALTIENRDSLLYGAQPSAVMVNISYEGATLMYRPADDLQEWTAYNSKDSLDLSTPLHLLLWANNGVDFRVYTMKLNIHQQEGDSLYWAQVDEDATAFKDMTYTRATVHQGCLMVFGESPYGVQLAKRNGVASSGIWTTQITNLPATAQASTLRQQGSSLYMSTSEGTLYTSTDGANWQQTGQTIPTLSLVAVSEKYYYALIDGTLQRSSDAVEWKAEALDDDPQLLPTSQIYSRIYTQKNGNERILICGNRDVESDQTAVVWSKLWYDELTEEDAEWTYFTQTHENQYSCPRLENLTILPYDGRMVAIGGNSLGKGTRKALDHMYFSNDNGITWKADPELHLPRELLGVSGPITATVDENNYIWIIANQQVWRGRLNRLGFARR